MSKIEKLVVGNRTFLVSPSLWLTAVQSIKAEGVEARKHLASTVQNLSQALYRDAFDYAKYMEMEGA